MFTKVQWAMLSLWVLGSNSIALGAEPAKASATPSTSPAAAAAPSPTPAPALALSPAQQKQVDALRTKTESQLAPLREQLAAKDRELQALWAAANPNRTEILKKDSEMAALRQKVRQALIDQRLSYLALLTTEQRAAWKAQRGGMGHGGMGHGGMGHDGMGHGGMGHGGMGHGGMDRGEGMGNMHGGMSTGGMGPGDCMNPASCMGLGDCMDCMDLGTTGACSAAAPGPASARPVAPPPAPAKPPAPPR